MAISFKHAFTSAKSDGVDPTLIQPSHWNAEHTLTLAASRVLGRDNTGAGAVQELGLGFTGGDADFLLGTGYLRVQRGTTAQRPGSPAAGMFRYDTTSTAFEGYDGSSWVSFGAAGSSSPTTTRGDLIRRGASADERLALGSSGQVLQSNGTDPVWASVAGLTAETSFCATRSTTQSIPNNVITTIQFNSELWDTSSAFNTGSFSFVAPVTGRYFFVASAQLQTPASGYHVNMLVTNSGATKSIRSGRTVYGTGGNQMYAVSGALNLTAGESITARITVFTGGPAINVVAADNSTFFTGYLIK